MPLYAYEFYYPKICEECLYQENPAAKTPSGLSIKINNGPYALKILSLFKVFFHSIVCVKYKMEVTNECFAAWEKLTNLEIKVRFSILYGPYNMTWNIFLLANSF